MPSMSSSEKISKEDMEGFSMIGFLSQIDWTEPWILLLVLWHVGVLMATVLARRRLNVQCALFLVLLGLVYFAEDINYIAAENWRLFARQQYFDSQGLFISMMFSMPCLFNCLLIVTNWLWCTNGAISQAMSQKIQAQQAEMKKDAAKKKE